MSKIKNIEKYIVFLLIFSMVLSGFSFVFADDFSDIENHWASSEIETWVERGLIEGYSDGTFRPDNNITRAEFMTLVNRAFGYTKEDIIGFPDVLSDDWFYSEVAKAKAAGYISGYPDGTMKPDNPISRQEVASIIVRMLGLEEDVKAVEKFADYSKISEWSRGYIGAVSAANIMEGYPDGTFKSENPIKRAEAVVALGKIGATIYDEPGDYGPSEDIEIINGDVIISADGVTLQNLFIKGNLILDKKIGEGDVTLKNVTVKGDTLIHGGGKDSVIFHDCILEGIVVVKKADSQVRIVAEGSTFVPGVILQSGAILLSEGDSSFGKVELSKDLVKDTEIVLTGNFDEVEVKAEEISVKVGENSKLENLILTKEAAGVKVDLDKKASVTTVKADAKVEITGKGSIGKAEINVDGVTIEQEPDKVDLKSGVKANVGGKDVSETKKSKGSGGPGSSGGSGDSDDPEDPDDPIKIEVSAISVTPKTVTLAVYGTKQLTVTVEPSNATNKKVIWTSDNEEVAIVDAHGKVTAVDVGEATITATSDADTKKSDSCVVTVKAEEDPSEVAKADFLEYLEGKVEDITAAKVKLDGQDITVTFDEPKDGDEGKLVGEVYEAAQGLVNALKEEVEAAELTIKLPEDETGETFNLQTDQNIEIGIAGYLLGLDEEGDLKEKAIEFLNGQEVTARYEATITKEAEGAEFVLKGDLTFKVDVDEEDPSEVAKADFLEYLEGKVGDIEGATVELDGEDITVIFDEPEGNEAELVSKVYAAAQGLVNALKEDVEAAELTIKLPEDETGVTFDLHEDEYIEIGIAGYLLELGVDGDLKEKAIEFLNGEEVTAKYEATITKETEGAEFKLEGDLTFKVDAQ